MSAQRASQLVEAGVWLQATGDQEGARRLFEQALKLDPENARARQFLGLGDPAEKPETARGASPPPHGAQAPASNGSQGYSSGGKPGTTRTLLFGPPGSGLQEVPPGSITPRPTAFDRPAPLPPPVEMDWGDAAGGEPQRQPVSEPPAFKPEPDWSARTPDTPSRRIRPDATSAWDAGSDPGVMVAAAESVGRSAFKDPLDLITEGIHTPLPMRLPDTQARRLQEELKTLLRGARDLQELDDHSGAMDLLTKALELDPLHREALALKERSEGTLLAIYESKLGGMDRVPRVLLKQDEVIWLNLDHRAGFVLAQIDGGVSYDDLFAICGMSRLDTARILAQLVEEGVIRS